MKKDNWSNRKDTMKCGLCIWFIQKDIGSMIGRCRKHAPKLNGWPVVYISDWCGDFKLDENSCMETKSC